MLTAYHMARDKFLTMVDGNVKNVGLVDDEEQYENHYSDRQAIILNPGDEKLLQRLRPLLKDKDERVIILKNIENFSAETLQMMKDHPKLILSGDIDKSPALDLIKNINFASQIFFSPSALAPDLPVLEKYKGHYISAYQNGIIHL
ncbi:hypothetical protein KBC03_04375 [Patescibacteria group bacterium]|nr:hypothetical protein [Patescibacteria group bacterium]